MSFLAKKMSAVDIRSNGGPENLFLKKISVPKLGEYDLLIKNKAIGVNRADCLQRKGNYPVPATSNPILGLEVAGDIVELGGKVQNFKIGDKVCALTDGGGYAEYSSVNYQHCFYIPENFNYIQSACIPEAAFTVYDNIFERAKLKSNETVLIHGGSSGIGSFAIQLVKAFGANVITTSGTKEKCDFCSNLGSDLSLNYNKDNWTKEIDAMTKGNGVNVILDIVAGDYINKNISIMSHKGRHITIALQKGRYSQIDFGLVMRKQLILSGSTLRPQSIDEKALTAQKIKTFIWPLLTKNQIKPHIHSVFSLNEVIKAHTLMESGSNYGKIVLQPKL